MEEQIRALIQQYGLNNEVKLLGAMTPEEVREHMERSQVFLFTSDRNEGWGAVLNEAMNSGCAVAASEAIGAVPYMICSGRNGFAYQKNDTEQLYRLVKQLLQVQALAEEMGKEAYSTVINCWNGSVAAQRLYEFCKAKLKGMPLPVYPDGPVSKDFGKVKSHG